MIPKPSPLQKAPRKVHPYEPESVAETTKSELAGEKETPPRKQATGSQVFSTRISADVVTLLKVAAAQRRMRLDHAVTEAITQWAKE